MFAHLHNHFFGSYSDSTLDFTPALKKARADGQPAMAMTEHGEIPFFIQYLDTCRNFSLKPIVGVEIYFVENASESILRKDSERFHLVLLAKNQKGLKNLFGLLSEAWIKNSYEEKRGLVDWGLLGQYADGLLALSGCFYNLVGQKFLREGEEAAELVLRRYLDIFGSDYYPEIGKHGIADEDAVNDFWLRVAPKYNLKPVASNDVHYLDALDWIAHDIIIKTRYDKVTNFKIDSQQYWLKTGTEMLRVYEADWLKNTLAVVEKIESVEISRLRSLAPQDILAIYQPGKLEAMFADGRAAHPAKIIYIDEETGRRHIQEVLQKYSYPEINGLSDEEKNRWLLARLANIPRRSEPDTEKVVISDQPLKEFIPLKRGLGKVMTQFSAQDCLALGATVVPARPTALQAELGRIFHRA